MSGFRVYYSDRRGYNSFDPEMPKPPTTMKTFDTRDEAVAFRATLPRDPDVIVTMTAAPPPRAKRTVDPNRAAGEEWLGGKMNSPSRKLTQ